MAAAPQPDPEEQPLISNHPGAYGEYFQDHLLEQYKLYVDTSQRVSEKRISTGNFLLTVNSSLLTLFGLTSNHAEFGRWLFIIPVAGALVSFAWLSIVNSYKNLNTAKFRVIHELEKHLPAALFRYEWHVCESGKGKSYTPITHSERLIPIIFAAIFVLLSLYALLRPLPEKESTKPFSVNGSLNLSVKEPVMIEQKVEQKAAPQAKQRQSKR